MTPAESVEERLRSLEQAVWGIRGGEGLIHQLKGLREDIGNWRQEDTVRRESSQRALVLALLAVTVSLIGTISGLVATLAG